MRQFIQRSTYDGTGYNRLSIRTVEVRSVADVQVSDAYQVRFGAGYQNIQYKKEREQTDKQTILSTFDSYPDTTRRAYDGDGAFPLLTQNSQSFKVNGFVENLFQIDEHLLLNVGGRIDYFDINQNLNISPRVNLSYQTPFGVTLRAAWGLYYQSPLYQQLIIAERTDTNTKAQRAIHYTFSAERRFELGTIGDADASLTVKIDAYYKDYTNLISTVRDYNNQALSNGGIIYPTRRNDALGFARGVDVFVAFSLARLSGWVSYGLLDAQEALLTNPTYFYPRFTDQRHALAFVSDYDFGNGWSSGLRYTFGSGLAYTPLLEVYWEAFKQWRWAPGAKNSANLPAYQRLDVRVDKRFDLFGLAATAFLDISNVTNHQNVVNYNYGFDADGKPEKTARTLWPIIPTLGLQVAF